MSGHDYFPALTKAQQEVREAQRARAAWIRAALESGRTKTDVAAELGISRQLLDRWLEQPR